MAWSETGMNAWFGHSAHFTFGSPQTPRTHLLEQAGAYPCFPLLEVKRVGKISERPRKSMRNSATFSVEVRGTCAVGEKGNGARRLGSVSRDANSTFSR